MDISKTLQTVIDVGLVVGFRVVGALIFYLVGRWLISFAISLVSAALEKQKVEHSSISIAWTHEACLGEPKGFELIDLAS